jgi:hypothetical protein
MSARNSASTREAPVGEGEVLNRTPARDRPGWRRVADRLVVPMKPGNAGGGKGPELKENVRRSEGKEIGDEPINSG